MFCPNHELRYVAYVRCIRSDDGSALPPSRLVCAIAAGQDVPNHGDVHVREAEQLSKLPQGVGRPLRAAHARGHREASGDGI